MVSARIPAAIAASYSLRKELRSCRLMLNVSLKLKSVRFQRPWACSSEGLSMAEKTAAPHSRYSTIRMASSRKRPLSSFMCKERQPCIRWPGIIQISAPLSRRTATGFAAGWGAAFGYLTLLGTGLCPRYKLTLYPPTRGSVPQSTSALVRAVWVLLIKESGSSIPHCWEK